MIKWLAAILLAILSAVGLNVISKEVEGWLDLLPAMLLRLARLRLPADQREALYDEWYAELHAALHGSEGRPLTRLWHGLRFAAGLVLAARQLGRNLQGVRRSGGEAELLLAIRGILESMEEDHLSGDSSKIEEVRLSGRTVTVRYANSTELDVWTIAHKGLKRIGQIKYPG